MCREEDENLFAFTFDPFLCFIHANIRTMHKGSCGKMKSKIKPKSAYVSDTDTPNDTSIKLLHDIQQQTDREKNLILIRFECVAQKLSSCESNSSMKNISEYKCENRGSTGNVLFDSIREYKPITI